MGETHTVGGDQDLLLAGPWAMVQTPPPTPSVDLHPASRHLARLVHALRRRHTVAVSRPLTGTETLEVVEDLWHVACGLRLMAPMLHYAVAVTYDEAEQQLAALAKALLEEHGRYEPSDRAYPSTIRYMTHLERAGGAAMRNRPVTRPAAVEFGAWLALSLHHTLAGLLNAAGQGHYPRLWPRWTYAAVAVAVAYSRTVEASAHHRLDQLNSD